MNRKFREYLYQALFSYVVEQAEDYGDIILSWDIDGTDKTVYFVILQSGKCKEFCDYEQALEYAAEHE
jgi:hypothetical protein